jgi:Right handed beta helix region
MLKRWILAATAALAMTAAPGRAATYYVAPTGAVIPASPDGSREKPFPSTDVALQSGRLTGGDTVLLMDGVHRMLRLNTAFSSDITFKSENGRLARVESIYANYLAKNIVIRDLKVWSTNPRIHEATLIYTGSTTSDLDFINLDVRGGEDAYNYQSWSASDWAARAANGIMLDGTRQVVRGSTFTGVYFGIVFGGSDNQALSNRVDGFAGDGMRGNGHRGIFRDNEVVNCVNFDGNHADGFQSFSGSSVIGLVLERNRFIEWMHDPAHPLRCGLQGIAMFDGFYENIRIVNNVVAGRNGHGITVNGGRGVEIINNTVVNIDGLQPGWPWIGVYPSRSGEAPINVIVANNLAMGYAGAADPARQVYFKMNRIVRIVSYAFPDWQQFNYMLRADSKFQDKALMEYAPALDVLRNKRPPDGPRDLGAYELNPVGADSTTAFAPPPAISAEADLAERQASAATKAATSTGAKFLSAP